MRSSLVSLFKAASLLLGVCAGEERGDAGINLPPSQGDSGTGAFIPGVYNYSYPTAYVAQLKARGFNALRLPINVPTATDAESLYTLKSYVDTIGGRAVFCMFGTANSTTGTHGTGIVDDVGAAITAWSKIHSAFAAYPHVKYEIFNEPQGYSSAQEYYATMTHIIKGAGLPEERCIIAATGWEQSPHPLVKLGWKGAVGYHFYPWWIDDGKCTQEAYSNMFQTALAGISNRTYVTEFGANLNLPNPDYEKYDASGHSGDVNCLRGMNDAVLALKRRGMGIKGAFHWHGWNNGDSFDFLSEANANGSAKVLKILSDAFSASGTIV